jgi:hypothetical protein
MNRKKKAGVAWFKRQNYEKVRRAFLDGQEYSPLYDDWLAKAHAFREQIEMDGREAILVEIEPVEFVRWCVANHLRTDARGRDCYVKLITYRIAMGKQAPFTEEE